MAKSRQKLQIKNGARGSERYRNGTGVAQPLVLTKGNILSIKQGKCEKMLQIFHKHGVGALRSAIAGSGDSQFK